METKIEFTLQELAQIALGAPKLNTARITIFHSLLNLLLKKLNCQNEKVTIGGLESECLQEILRISKVAPIAIEDEQLEVFTEKIDSLLGIENRLSDFETKLEKHIEDVCQRCHSLDEEQLSCDDREDLCSCCLPGNEAACNILENTEIVKTILHCLAAPMLARMQEYATKINRLDAEVKSFIQQAQLLYKTINLIDYCEREVVALRKTIEQNHATFLTAMNELQEMLDAKLSKLEVPALRKYLENNIARLEASIESLYRDTQYLKAAGVVVTGKTYISGRNYETQNVPNVSSMSATKTKQKRCPRNGRG